MISFIELGYFLCFTLLFGMALFVWSRNWHSGTNRAFAVISFSLLGWLVTLFLFNRSSDPLTVLWLGRLNFAAIVLAAPAALYFTWIVSLRSLDRGYTWQIWIVSLIFILTAVTPLVDKAEIVSAGSSGHTTVYGPLFPIYALYVVGYLTAAVWLAFAERGRHRRGPVRDQLLLIGVGILATGIVGLVTNALLPFVFGDFRLVDVGPLSTILFLAAIAYAVLKHRLFSIRLFVKRALVYGILLSLALAAYSAFLILATERFAGSDSFSRFGMLLVAFSFDPLRRVLEKHIDRLMERSFPLNEAEKH